MARKRNPAAGSEPAVSSSLEPAVSSAMPQASQPAGMQAPSLQPAVSLSQPSGSAAGNSSASAGEGLPSAAALWSGRERQDLVRQDVLRHDLVDPEVPTGMVRITDGRAERFIWPVHLGGWEEQGWRLSGSGAVLLPAAARPAAVTTQADPAVEENASPSPELSAELTADEDPPDPSSAEALDERAADPVDPLLDDTLL